MTGQPCYRCGRPNEPARSLAAFYCEACSAEDRQALADSQCDECDWYGDHRSTCSHHDPNAAWS